VIKKQTIGTADNKMRVKIRHRIRNRHQQESLIFWQSKPRWAQRAGSFAGASFSCCTQPRLKIKRLSSRILALPYIILAKLDKRPGETPENAHLSFIAYFSEKPCMHIFPPHTYNTLLIIKGY
jgi:hypothetical protein